jgi:glycosyltransferase involved in cell wall biosynthesis
MKVLFVSSGNSFYGISPIVARQGISLEKKGIEIEYYGIKGHGLKGYFRNIFLLRRFTKLSKPDIIHAHYGLSAIVAFLARRGKKLVVSFMGSDVLGSEDINWVNNFISKVSIIINKFLAKFSYHHIIVKSEEMLQKFSKSYNVSLIPNGIDINDFYFTGKKEAREELKLNAEEKIVLFISNPERPEKNYNLALAAIKLSDYKISMIPIFNISSDRLKYYYSAADVLIMTSLYEGSPNVVKEAMACDCPVVATDVGNVRWLFGETHGYYITSFDPVNIADSIKLAIDFREKQGKTKGRERITELGLDSETVAGEIVEVYKKVLKIDD